MTCHLVNDYKDIIIKGWQADPTIQQFSRNCNESFDIRINKEMNLLSTAPFLQFYKLQDNDNFIGYFGIELKPVAFLNTIFIMPEFRNKKEEIWNYVISFLPNTFFSGLFLINIRAIKFYQKHGGKIIAESIVENKPIVLFEFNKG